MSKHTPPSTERDALAALDLELCVDVDRFGFALAVERRAGLLVMRAVPAPAAGERVSG